MISYISKLVDRKTIVAFVEKWHYSHNINGVICDYCFGLYDNDILVGAAILGRPAMANQYKKYCSKLDELTELRRFCCIDATPKNTESYFIGSILRFLRSNTKLKYVLSYADENHGHIGTIYKASNFKYLGKTSPGRVILYNGKCYHDKSIRSKYKGKLKPFAKILKNHLETGQAVYKKQLSKHIYLYELYK